MSLQLKRWLRIAALLVVALYLCWQNAGDSIRITNWFCALIRRALLWFGIEIKNTDTLYVLVRKLGHCLIFVILAFEIGLSLNAKTASRWTACLVTVAIGLAIAISTEIIQLFVGRIADIYDVLIDGTGATIGALISTHRT